ncbi:amidohydrolase family protein [Kribbella sp. NPDC058245]|uniref:amidohydrolase family protein n=1 Tax=Kribbella sp. NPDC058245 TaxID=3346399 RepID=UPI0036EF5EF7
MTTTPTIIRNVAVFDGVHLQQRADVLIDGPTIAAVGPDLAVPAGATVIDGLGYTLLPGLIDAHTHTMSTAQLHQALVFGVTTELDMGGVPEHSRALRAAAQARSDLADFRIATTGATAPGGHPSQLVELGFMPPFPTVAGPEDAERFVADRIADGADHLKIFIEDGTAAGHPMPLLAPETIKALVAAAHDRGLKAIAHTMTRSATWTAVNAGVDGLAHAPADGPSDQALIDAVADAGLFVVPTLATLAGMSEHPVEFRLAADPRLRPYADPQWLEDLKNLPADPAQRMGPMAMDVRNAADFAIRVFRAGVPLVAGTDGTGGAGHPTTHGISLHGELTLMVEAGLSPAEALITATSAAADAFGLADRGRIAPGLRADLLLATGAPNSEITSLYGITKIWKQGVLVDRTATFSDSED